MCCKGNIIVKIWGITFFIGIYLLFMSVTFVNAPRPIMQNKSQFYCLLIGVSLILLCMVAVWCFEPLKRALGFSPHVEAIPIVTPILYNDDVIIIPNENVIPNENQCDSTDINNVV